MIKQIAEKWRDFWRMMSNCGPSPGASCLGGISSAIPSVAFARNTTGWEAFAGIRHVPFFGAEVEYIDFDPVAHLCRYQFDGKHFGYGGWCNDPSNGDSAVCDRISAGSPAPLGHFR
jgi:hypothetical protein